MIAPKRDIKLFFLISIIFLIIVFAPFKGICSSSEQSGFVPSGDGTISYPYLIYTVEDFLKIGKSDEWSLDKHYKLMNDISFKNLEQYEWTPIGNDITPFTGTFDGNNKAIYDLNIERSDSEHMGIFGVIRGEKVRIENLGIENITITIRSYNSNLNTSIGGLVCINDYGTIENCYLKGKISSDFSIGGLVRKNSGSIINCYVDLSIESFKSYVGGLAGTNLGEIQESFTLGSFKASGDCGGLVALNSGIIKMSYSKADIVGNSRAGGLVVSHIGGFIERCFFSGKISGAFSSTGGIAGEVSYENLGVGNNSVPVISDCYSTSYIIGNTCTGGIVGYLGTGTVKNCYFSGYIFANNTGMHVGYMGGIAGVNMGVIESCFLLSENITVTKNISINSIAINGGEIYNSYALRASSIVDTKNIPEYFIGKNDIYPNILFISACQASSPLTYESIGWDFSSEDPIWEMKNDFDFPKLVGVKGQE